MSDKLKLKDVPAERVEAAFGALMREEKVAFKPNDGSVYIGAFLGERLVGVVGILKQHRTIRFKTDYVHPAHRGQGVYAALWGEREARVKPLRFNAITAFCTDKSLPKYLREGFRAMNRLERGVTFVRRQWGEGPAF